MRFAFEQVQRYAADSGIKFACISNGTQFVIFDAFKRGGWKNGYCYIFHSFDDIKLNFPLFWNVLSKKSVYNGSLREFISKERPTLHFEKALDYFSYQEQKITQNSLASSLYPINRHVFGEITDEGQKDILKNCYVYNRLHSSARKFLLPRFDGVPYDATKFGFENLYETSAHAGKFQISFEKCERFLRTEKSEGSLIILLGGIGCGKTTFIHHFFNVTMRKRKKVLWFYVDFRQSMPDPEKIESYIYDSIIEDYERKYKDVFSDELEEVGFSELNAEYKDVLQLFSILNLKGYTISLVLDNVDQHSLLSPEYQERSFLISQNLTTKLKTITILTLREESFFKSTRSGVLDAYDMALNKFHISSPKFESVLRKRIDYVYNLLDLDEDEIFEKSNIRLKLSGEKNVLKMLFKILSRSLNSRRKMGNDILQFIDDISGGDMRKALYLFNQFLISGNTDIDEMMNIEIRSNPLGTYWKGYYIPEHHIMNSIILEDSRYYSLTNSQIFNVFNVNPGVTNSHFLHLRVLDYLNKRKNYYSKMGNGYVDISSILLDSQTINDTREAAIDSIIILAEYSLVEFNNQSKEGFKTASHVRITNTGIYYYENLIYKFVYLDLMWGDTPIADDDIILILRNNINVDDIRNDMERIKVRFNRTEVFLKYLKKMEDNEWGDNPELIHSNFSNNKFTEEIIKQFENKSKDILRRMIKVRERYQKDKEE